MAGRKEWLLLVEQAAEFKQGEGGGYGGVQGLDGSDSGNGEKKIGAIQEWGR